MNSGDGQSEMTCQRRYQWKVLLLLTPRRFQMYQVHPPCAGIRRHFLASFPSERPPPMHRRVSLQVASIRLLKESGLLEELGLLENFGSCMQRRQTNGLNTLSSAPGTC